MFTVSLPVIFINAPLSALKTDAFLAQDIIGLILIIVGILLETFADMQKFNFRDNPANKGKWCTYGKLKSQLVWIGTFRIFTIL